MKRVRYRCNWLRHEAKVFGNKYADRALTSWVTDAEFKEIIWLPRLPLSCLKYGDRLARPTVSEYSVRIYGNNQLEEIPEQR